VEVAIFPEAFDCWARAQRDIVGVALVGSHARDTANEESDVDLIISTCRLALRLMTWIACAEVSRSMGPLSTISAQPRMA